MAIKQVERNEAEEFDINDPSLMEGEVSQLDLNEDWQAKAPPPPGRTAQDKPRLYKIRFHYESKMERTLKDGFKADDPNGYFYTTQLIGKIQDPAGTWQDSVVYYKVSSFLNRGKKISTMAGFLKLARINVPSAISELALAKLLPKAMEALDRKDGPVLIGDCDWSCWDVDDTKKGRSPMGSQKEAGMWRFPRKADGTHNHILIGVTGRECIAKLKVNKLIPLAVPAAVPPNGVVQQVKPIVTTPIPPKPPVQENLLQEGGIVMDGDGEVVIDMS